MQKPGGIQVKFIVGGLVILAGAIYLIASSFIANAQYFVTVDELAARGSSVVGKNITVSGAVIGDSIEFDPDTHTLKFTIVHVPGTNKEIDAEGGLAEALHRAVGDTSRRRLTVVFNGPQPDLLRDEAQAIVPGKLGEDGIFYATDLRLKCPSRYENAVPDQAEK